MIGLPGSNIMFAMFGCGISGADLTDVFCQSNI